MGRLKPCPSTTQFGKSYSPIPLPKTLLIWVSCAQTEQLMATKKIRAQTQNIRLIMHILQNPIFISCKGVIQSSLRQTYIRCNSTKPSPDRTRANSTLSFQKDLFEPVNIRFANQTHRRVLTGGTSLTETTANPIKLASGESWIFVWFHLSLNPTEWYRSSLQEDISFNLQTSYS
jgi:hypothetical protein